MKKLNSYIFEKLKLDKNISAQRVHFESFTEKIIKTSGVEYIVKDKSKLKDIERTCNIWYNAGEFSKDYNLKIFIESEDDILFKSLKDEYDNEYIEDKDKITVLERILDTAGRNIYSNFFDDETWGLRIDTTKNILKIRITKYLKGISGGEYEGYTLYYIPSLNKEVNEKLNLDKDSIGGKRYKFRFPESKIYILSGITDLTDSMFQDKISSGIESWVRGTDKDDIKCIIKSEDSLPIESLYLKYENEYIVDENKWNKLSKQFKEDSLNIYGGWYKHIEFRIRTDEDKKILLVSVRVNEHNTNYYTSNTYEIYFLKSDSKILTEKLHIDKDTLIDEFEVHFKTSLTVEMNKKRIKDKTEISKFSIEEINRKSALATQAITLYNEDDFLWILVYIFDIFNNSITNYDMDFFYSCIKKGIENFKELKPEIERLFTFNKIKERYSEYLMINDY